MPHDFRPIAGKPVDIEDCEMVGEPAHFIMVFLRAVKALERIADRMEKGK
jgi:hypothetical protein